MVVRRGGFIGEVERDYENDGFKYTVSALHASGDKGDTLEVGYAATSRDALEQAEAAVDRYVRGEGANVERKTRF